jgi:hypothetical protein
MMQAADLRDGDDLPDPTWHDRARVGQSLSSDRCVDVILDVRGEDAAQMALVDSSCSARLTCAVSSRLTLRTKRSGPRLKIAFFLIPPLKRDLTLVGSPPFPHIVTRGPLSFPGTKKDPAAPCVSECACQAIARVTNQKPPRVKVVKEPARTSHTALGDNRSRL